MVTVRILGAGCPTCRQLEAEIRAVFERMRPPMTYEVVRVSDVGEIMHYGVLRMPALVMNERLVSAGRVPKREEIREWALELGE